MQQAAEWGGDQRPAISFSAGGLYRSCCGGVELLPPSRPLQPTAPPPPPPVALAKYYKVPLTRCLVVSDDLDQPTAVIRLKQRGGHGGHNGLRSIIERFGGKSEFPRLKIGAVGARWIRWWGVGRGGCVGCGLGRASLKQSSSSISSLAAA